jgi:hypothetical protein
MPRDGWDKAPADRGKNGGIAASVCFCVRAATQIADVIKQPIPVSGQARRVRYWGEKGKHLLAVSISAFDPQGNAAGVYPRLLETISD